MIVRIGDLFNSEADTLVNTINCVGVMGKGIAKEFKKRYPLMFNDYVERCNRGLVRPGTPYYYQDDTVSIINFPTKDHWRSPSKLSYIIQGLEWFVDNYSNLGIKSVAFPPLGCGNGGLSWQIVGPIMYEKLSPLPIDIELYAPYGTTAEQISEEYLKSHLIDYDREILGNSSGQINKSWLLILYVVQALNNSKYALNVGRTIFQKICYVLTREGVRTGFRFVEGSYGPYSSDVKKAIMILSNANLMSERQLGKMVETVVNPSFSLDFSQYSQNDIQSTRNTIDLMSRVKSTDQAEMIATVLFAYDVLRQKSEGVTEKALFEHIHEWKKWWGNEKDKEILDTMGDLSALGWVKPDSSHDKVVPDEDLY